MASPVGLQPAWLWAPVREWQHLLVSPAKASWGLAVVRVCVEFWEAASVPAGSWSTVAGMCQSDPEAAQAPHCSPSSARGSGPGEGGEERPGLAGPRLALGACPSGARGCKDATAQVRG